MYTSSLNLLADLGLSEQEARTYIALLERGGGTVAEIALHAGVKRTSIYNFIDKMVSDGIVICKVTGKRKSYFPISPDELLQVHRRRLNHVSSHIGELAALANDLSDKPRVSYYQGEDQLRRLLLETLNCNREALFIWPAENVLSMLGGPSFMIELNTLRLQAGIFIRSIRFYDKDVAYPGSHSFQTSDQENLQDIRYHPDGSRFPMAVCIFDTKKVAYISSKNEGFGFMIESNELHTSMSTLFESFWESAPNQ